MLPTLTAAAPSRQSGHAGAIAPHPQKRDPGFTRCEAIRATVPKNPIKQTHRLSGGKRTRIGVVLRVRPRGRQLTLLDSKLQADATPVAGGGSETLLWLKQRLRKQCEP